MELKPHEIKALRELLDKEAIREACLKYTRGIDRHDDELALQAYHEGAIDDHGAFIGDAAAFIRAVGPVHDATAELHQHHITNQTIELDGDTAHGETYFIAALKRHDGGTNIAGGRYIDRFERRGERWAIAARVCMVEWRGEFPRSGRVVDPDLFVSGSADRNDISYQRPLTPSRPHRDHPA